MIVRRNSGRSHAGRVILATAMAALLGPGGLASAAWRQDNVPANDGWVTDLAHLLSDEQQRSLEETMESYRSGTAHEIAVLIVPELGQQSLERLSLETARAWGMGQKDENDGALFLVAVKERKMRIEVGRGLEGVLPDSICGRILRDIVQPRFRSGDFYGGIREGVLAIHSAIGGDYGPVDRARPRGNSAFGGVFFGLFFVFLMFIARRHRARRHGIGGLNPWLWMGAGLGSGGSRSGSSGGGFSGGGGFGGFGGGGGFSGGGASGGW